VLRRNITRAIDDGIRDAKSRLHNITMAPPYQKGARIVKAAKPSEEGGEARAGICHHNKARYVASITLPFWRRTTESRRARQCHEHAQP
jgi:hypothetical protein